MELGDLTIEVRNKNLQRVHIVNLRDAEVLLQDIFNDVGYWSVTLPLGHAASKHLAEPGAGIVARGPGGIFLSGPCLKFSTKATKADPEGLIVFEGCTDSHHLADRLGYPVPASPDPGANGVITQSAAVQDERTGPVESVIHGFVNANIGPGAAASRRVPMLSMGPNQARGQTVKYGMRYDVLGEKLSEIAALGPIGFRIRQVGTALQFQTYALPDKSKTIRMDLWNNTLAGYESAHVGPSVTRAIVGGQEEGTNRTVIEVTTPDSVAGEGLYQRRIERFYDRRSEGELEYLKAGGLEALAEQGKAQDVLTFTPMDETTMRYLIDWELGDQVAAVVDGVELTSIVTQAIIKISKDGVIVQAALGDVEAQKTGESIKSLGQRVSNLEKNAELPSDLSVLLQDVRDLPSDLGAVLTKARNTPSYASSATAGTLVQRDSNSHTNVVSIDARLSDGSYLRMSQSGFNRYNTSGAGSQPIGFANGRLINVGTPTSGTDAATKAYVDAEVKLAGKPEVYAGNTDLNTLTSSGVWIVLSYTQATTALNFPVAAIPGMLEVFDRGTGAPVYQRFTERAGKGRMWNRTLTDSGGTWSPWLEPSLLEDTGWVPVTLESGTTNQTSHDTQVRRIGKQVFLRGRLSREVNGGNQVWAHVPSGFTPPRIVEIPHRAHPEGNYPHRVFVTNSGSIETQLTPSSGQLLLNTSWLID